MLTVRRDVATDVCPDLVLYDIPARNPFRSLVPLTKQHPLLFQTIIANAALHMSNACQKPFTLAVKLHGESYTHAFAAKQQALRLLRIALMKPPSIDQDVLLMAVLLLVEFALIDSGQEEWSCHIKGAESVVGTLYGPFTPTQQFSMNPLRRCLTENYSIFGIIGSTLSPPSDGHDIRRSNIYGNVPLLEDAEGNHCSSFPSSLLQVLQAGARLSRPSSASGSITSSDREAAAICSELISTTEAFDPQAWASNLHLRSDVENDPNHRTHIASAHRAAVLIYLTRLMLSYRQQDITAQLCYDLESLVTRVIVHVSAIPPSNPLFAATTWPSFIAGAETRVLTNRGWAKQQLGEVWNVQPWGSVKGAARLLEELWAGRPAFEDGTTTPMTDGDWVDELRHRGVEWLIL
ncbi:hypothetical protein LTR73_008516 [Friedmanniomyces endolithicus]|nr:hypothetical protein LTR73_008516 [Friedmanniomyces endolithicus]